MNFDELEEIVDLVAEQLDEHIFRIEKFVQNIKHTKFPSTYFAIFGFLPKIESIRISIFELVKMGEVYSEKILFRALCEHYLKSQYIIMRFMQEKTDEVGKEYFLFCGAQEELQFANSLKKRASILGKDLDIDPLKILKQYEPFLENESKKSIINISDQFKYRNIIDYITKIIDRDKGPLNTFLPNIIPVYSDLSSFVHGGPSTHRISEVFANEELATESLRNDAQLSLQMSLAIRSFAFLLFTKEDKKMSLLFNIGSMSFCVGNIKKIY